MCTVWKWNQEKKKTNEYFYSLYYKYMLRLVLLNAVHLLLIFFFLIF